MSTELCRALEGAPFRELDVIGLRVGVPIGCLRKLPRRADGAEAVAPWILRAIADELGVSHDP
jgi:hypothetical protein